MLASLPLACVCVEREIHASPTLEIQPLWSRHVLGLIKVTYRATKNQIRVRDNCAFIKTFHIRFSLRSTMVFGSLATASHCQSVAYTHHVVAGFVVPKTSFPIKTFREEGKTFCPWSRGKSKTRKRMSKIF